ncbi:hypothetical protein JCM6882_003136 [Rhodosporidiobolus microsporus]
MLSTEDWHNHRRPPPPHPHSFSRAIHPANSADPSGHAWLDGAQDNGGAMDGAGGYAEQHQQPYEPHAHAGQLLESAPVHYAYPPQQLDELDEQQQQQRSFDPPPAMHLTPRSSEVPQYAGSSPINNTGAYSVSPSGRAYFDVAHSGGRKRAYEESFGADEATFGGTGAGEEGLRARRVPSGASMTVPPSSGAYGLSASTSALYRGGAELAASPVPSPATPHHPSPSPYYPQTSSALSQPPLQASYLQHARVPSGSTPYASSTSYLPSSSHPPSSQAAEAYQPSYESYDSPSTSHIPPPLASYSAAPSRIAATAYQSPQPSPSLPAHILPHRFQQQQQYVPSDSSPASAYQPHPSPAPSYPHQRAFSLDASSHPYHFPSPYRRERSPSASSVVPTRPATSIPQSSYGGTSYAPSSYGQQHSPAPFGYNSAPRVTSQSFGSFSTAPVAETVVVPSPAFSHRSAFEDPASAPAAIQTFTPQASSSSFRPGTAPMARATYGSASVYSQPPHQQQQQGQEQQQDWLQASQPAQQTQQQQQLSPFLPPSSASGAYYSPAPPALRPATSSGPSPTHSSFSAHSSTTSSQPPLSATLPTYATSHTSTTPSRQPTPPQILPSSLPALHLASTARTAHRTSAPVLAFNPAREPASSARQRVQSEYGVTYSVASSGSNKGKAKSAEVPASCWTCQTARAKVILRGADLSGFAPRLHFTCLDCLPIETGDEADEEGDKGRKEKERLERLAAKAEAADRVMLGLADEEENAAGVASVAGSSYGGTASPAILPAVPGGSVAGEALASSTSSSSAAGAALVPVPGTPTPSAAASASGAVVSLPSPSEHDRVTFKDTFSGAVDFIEGRPGGAGANGEKVSRALLPPEETKSGLPAHLKRQALTCDVCDRIVGAGSISSLMPGPVPTFSVEVICYPCDEKYRPCSDCGGGGGRLTPGRWRCKELFPAGRRTCTLSHARNPPLDDIEYDVLRATEIDPSKLDSLENRCRLIYFNTRLRTQARPEMLERADGLATTYAQCEKLTVDGWSLLKPMLSEDVEPARNLRRYVGIQTSTPHRRRSKPKPGAPPRPEPVEEEAAEKEISGFILLEHDFEKGAIFIAVTMPWAIAGDAFDATTVLMDDVIKRVRADVHELNAAREREGFEPYPEPWCVWGITPFKADSRMTQSLSRRGLEFLEDYVATNPKTDLTCFPPHREIHIPNEFVKTFKIFIRSVTADDGIGAPPASVGGKVTGTRGAKGVKSRKGRGVGAK